MVGTAQKKNFGRIWIKARWVIIAKQQSCHKFIYKLPSKRLKQAKWNLTLPLQSAMKNKNDIVALNDSQILRWICELNGIENLPRSLSIWSNRREVPCAIKYSLSISSSRLTIALKSCLISSLIGTFTRVYCIVSIVFSPHFNPNSPKILLLSHIHHYLHFLQTHVQIW